MASHLTTASKNEHQRTQAMTSANPAHPANPEASSGAPDGQSHDFEVQKQVHQQIRNDPDYDDWEYGTEPLPHEAWVAQVNGNEQASA
jgi:hypothetical protein